ncbi:MAG: hypothetical protein AAF840_13790 [Bacteroidota bacterium]
MGFESKLSGYIASYRRHNDEAFIKKIETVIHQLPTLEEDTWPFLPRDIFALTKPISATANPVRLSYRSAMIHFAMSVKQIEDGLPAWLAKFEAFFKQVPGAYEANVVVSLEPYTGGYYRNGNLNYFWKASTDKEGVVTWTFSGDPTTIEGIAGYKI